MQKNVIMTLGGIGPKLMMLCLPYILLSLTVMFQYPEFGQINFINHNIYKIIGIIWGILGVIFWIYSIIIFLSDFKKGELITRGTFALCRNPVYASMMVFIIPALGLIFNSGLIFSIAVVFYLSFKISIHGEVNILRKSFGEDYEIYVKSVNEVFPFPKYLFQKRRI